jgi:hypothetical protein
MSSQKRFSKAYKEAKRISFNDDSKLVFLVIATEETTALQTILQIIKMFIFMHLSIITKKVLLIVSWETAQSFGKILSLTPY